MLLLKSSSSELCEQKSKELSQLEAPVVTNGARDAATRQCGTLDAAQWPRAARQVGGGGDVSAAASLKAASSTAVKSKCSPGERCAGPGARITFVLRSRALAS